MIKSIDWETPQAFVVAALLIFLIWKKWGLILLTLMTLFIGSIIENYFVFNIELNSVPISSPLIVYTVGSIVIIIMVIVSLVK